jgi:hypothetical protein
MGRTPDGGDTADRHTMSCIMAKSYNRSRKPELSPHQKQMRFFTGLSMCIAFGFIFVVFWLLNRPVFSAH